MDYKRIRIDIRASLDRYARHGIGTGDFLRCVLSNDLMGAIMRADDENSATLRDICGYVYNELPSSCHGSPVKVKAWIDKHARLRELARQAEVET